MSYEPRGKVKQMIDAMREPGAAKVWPSGDCASLMNVFTSSLPGYLDAAIKHGVMYRFVDNGRAFYSLQPFAKEDTLPGLAIPKFDEAEWSPPKMVPPRGGSELPRAALPEPLLTTPPPAPAPKFDRAPEPEPGPVEPEVEGSSDFNAVVWLDGDLDLFGLTELEGGGHRISATDVQRLRRMIAWGPT